MCSRLHGSWTLARPPTRGQHTGMPCRRMPQKGVGHRGSPGLPGQGRVVQHDGSLHAQQGGQAPGHQVVQQDGAEGGRVQVQSLRSSTCPTPHSARCRASGPAPAQPRTPPAEGKHVQSRLSANSPLIVPQRGVVFVCLNMALSTDPALRLLLSIKFYWHTAVPTCVCIVSGCFTH